MGRGVARLQHAVAPRPTSSLPDQHRAEGPAQARAHALHGQGRRFGQPAGILGFRRPSAPSLRPPLPFALQQMPGPGQADDGHRVRGLALHGQFPGLFPGDALRTAKSSVGLGFAPAGGDIRGPATCQAFSSVAELESADGPQVVPSARRGQPVSSRESAARGLTADPPLPGSRLPGFPRNAFQGDNGIVPPG